MSKKTQYKAQDKNKYIDQTDAALKLILATQTNSTLDLGKIWMEGYNEGLRTETLNPNQYTNREASFKLSDIYNETEVEYWMQGWFAGFNQEVILFYDQGKFKPISNKSNKNKHVNILKSKNTKDHLKEIHCLA